MVDLGHLCLCFKPSFLRLLCLPVRNTIHNVCVFRVQCGLVGAWRADVRDDGRPVAIRHCWEL